MGEDNAVFATRIKSGHNVKKGLIMTLTRKRCPKWEKNDNGIMKSLKEKL